MYVYTRRRSHVSDVHAMYEYIQINMLSECIFTYDDYVNVYVSIVRAVFLLCMWCISQ